MATANDFFPSNYLRAADLGGKETVATIDHVETGTFENDGRKQQKPVVHFRGSLKPLVCNKTNFLLIAASCGDDTDAWPGKQIRLFSDMVSFQGRVQEAIRVRPHMQTDPAPEMNDEVPF